MRALNASIILLVISFGVLAAQKEEEATLTKVGQAAPDFTLPSTLVGADGKRMRYKLSDFKGKKNVVLAFYVFAFTGG